ncbi:hypothetical protein BGW38_005605 [Lunasporangiospora selenospora]|uniref:Uncharacterized protein n=1 Tax=Lunasporangiospora selenospora TaxID=979761 RepID=A0A9P6FPQ4_9FUNG|nr:hypothetical protein BGW38_005605 [Lunasporangiospora selenospora]
MSVPAASWKSTFSNVPSLTKSVSTAMTLMTFLGLALRFRDFLITRQGTPEDPYTSDSEGALIPLLAVVPYAINTAVLLGSGKYLERAWGSRAFFQHLVVSSIGPMVAVYVTCIFEYIIWGDETVLFSRAYGLTGVMSGFLIGFKQLVPEHLVTVWGLFTVRVKLIPLLFTTFMLFFSLITRNQIEFLLTVYGLYITWIYTRFFRAQDGIKGDRSETFSFASFFPELVQPLVKGLSNICFAILVKLKICSPTGYSGFQYGLENPQMSTMGHTFTQPGSLRAEAERRRALALKALDMRLHAASGNNSGVSGAARPTFTSTLSTSSSSSTGATPSNPPAVQPTRSSTDPPSTTIEIGDGNEVLFETSALDGSDPVVDVGNISGTSKDSTNNV